MKVFIAGATGAIGRPLVRQLVDHGHEVVALSRSAQKAEDLRRLGVSDVAIADALDRRAVLDAVTAAAPDAIIHQLTAIGSIGNPRKLDVAFEPTNRLRTIGTDNLVAAAEASGVKQFVAQSFGAFAYARTGTGLKTEADELVPNPPPGQRQVIAAIKHLESAVLGAAGPQGTVLRYAGFYGPGTSVCEGGEMIDQVRKRAIPVLGDGGGVWSFIHVEDAASATVCALESGVSGVLNVVDDEPAAVRDWLPALAQAVGAKPPRHLPVWLGRLVVGQAGVEVMTQMRGMSNAGLRELGWRPQYPTYREGFTTGLGAVPAA